VGRSGEFPQNANKTDIARGQYSRRIKTGKLLKSTLGTFVNNSFFSAIATVAIAAATAQPSLAQDQPATDSPVSIASCTLVPTYDPVLTNESEDPETPTGDSVWISFVNDSVRTVTEVTFHLDSVDGSERITDRGRFTRGVTIQHALGPVPDFRGETTCGVYSVRYDDGTVWQLPQTTSSRR
jgi:hypothetical protein